MKAPQAFRGALAAAVLCCCGLAPAGAVQSVAPAARAPADACGAQAGDKSIFQVRKLLEGALSRIPPPQTVDSRHLALVVPAELARRVGSEVAAHAYASMPKTVKGGELPKTVFTKFVVVAHSSTQGPAGISIGDDVCGDAGFANKEAVRFLRTEMQQRLKDFTPPVLSCAAVGACPERMSPGLDGQLPFLRALRDASGRKGGQPLRGDLLPVMMQSQDVELSVKVGAALSLLVQPGGVWEGERVLFVFAGDMSDGLSEAQALHCDDKATQILTRRGVAQAAEYFATLLHGGASEGCVGPKSAPRGYGPMLAAARVAADLRMLSRRVAVSHENDVLKGVSRGFGSIIFWDDTHSLWEQHAAAAATAPALLDGGARKSLRSAPRNETRG